VVIWRRAIGAGMAFHAQISEFIVRLEGSDAGAEAVGVLLGGYIALKWWERRRFYRALRIARIGRGRLASPDDGGRRRWSWTSLAQAPGISIRVSFPALAMTPPKWTGARRAAGDREIVFYCTCPTRLRRRKSQKKLMGSAIRKCAAARRAGRLDRRRLRGGQPAEGAGMISWPLMDKMAIMCIMC